YRLLNQAIAKPTKEIVMAEICVQRREVLRLLSGWLAAGAASSIPGGYALAATGQLVVSDFGGDWGTWNKQNIDARFTEATKIPVSHDTGSDNPARIAKARLGIPRSEYDLICLADAFFARAEAEGILEKLNYQSPRLSNSKDIIPRFVT